MNRFLYLCHTELSGSALLKLLCHTERSRSALLKPLCHSDLRQGEMVKFGISVYYFQNPILVPYCGLNWKLEIRNWKLEIDPSLVPFRKKPSSMKAYQFTRYTRTN